MTPKVGREYAERLRITERDLARAHAELADARKAAAKDLATLAGTRAELEEMRKACAKAKKARGLHIGERDRVILERYFGAYKDGQCGLDAICRVLLGRSE